MGSLSVPRFMKETRQDVFHCGAPCSCIDIRLTHLPTGLVAEAKNHDEAVDKLGRLLNDEHYRIC